MEKWVRDAFAGYVAAMIDGEGHIEINSDYAVRVRIANTVKPTLDAIVKRLKFGRVVEYRRPEGSTYKRLFSVEVSNVHDVGKLFALCGKFIHMKRDRMRAALRVVRRVLKDGDALDVRNRKILAAIKSGKVQKEIAKAFGVSPQLVSRIKSGHTWASVMAAHRARSLKKKFPRSMDQSFRLHGVK